MTMTLEQASYFYQDKMSLTPREPTKKKSRSRDWHIHYLPESDNTSPEALSVLKCPFNTIPEPKDSVSAKFTEKVRYLQGGQNEAPYTGYYALLNNALVSVSNVYGVWFEVHLRENKFKCFWLAQNELGLKNYLLSGINFIQLEQSGIPTQPPTRPPSHIKTWPTEERLREAGSRFFSTEQMATMLATTTQETLERIPTSHNDPSSNEEEELKDKEPFGSFKVWSSYTACRKPPHQPWGTRDDPFTFGNLLDKDKDNKGHCLEGIHPDKYNGDWSQMIRFLNTFNQFMLINYKADIAKDPIIRSIYFLLLLEGPKCEGWVDMADKWLQQVADDPSIIPCPTNIWHELEKKFKESSSNYAEHERAQDKLKRLKMKGNNLDEYLTAFKTLGQHAELNPNNPSNLQTFSLGLPQSLADACIKMESPETYKQWRAAFQHQQKIYLKTKALHSEYRTPSGNHP